MAREIHVDADPDELENWSESIKIRPRRVVTFDDAPDGTERQKVKAFARVARKLGSQVRDAAARGRHVRAVGSRWSFSGLLGCDDVIVRTNHGHQDAHGLNGILSIARRGETSSLLAQATKAGRGPKEGWAQVYLEAGCVLDDVMHALDDEGLAVPTAGASSGQTIAGVIATCTHGADFDLPPFPDFVRALVMVTVDGAVRWIEPSQGFADDPTALVPGLKPEHVHRDDQLFRAALVSVGAIGVVVGLVLSVREKYFLREHREATTWKEASKRMTDGTLFDPPAGAEGHFRFLEVLVNPYKDRNGERRVYLVRRFERDAGDADPWKRQQGFIVWAGLLSGLATATHGTEHFRRSINGLIEASREGTGSEFRNAHDVFNFGRARAPRVWSVEACVSTKGAAHVALMNRVLKSVDRLLAKPDKPRFAGFYSMRFSKRTRALLGPQTGPTEGNRYCHIETFAPVLAGNDALRESELFIRAFEKVVRNEAAKTGLARLSWGQRLDRPWEYAVNRAFSGAKKWREARARLTPSHPWAFTNPTTLHTRLVGRPESFSTLVTLPSVSGDDLAWFGDLARTAPVGFGDRLMAVSGNGAAGWVHPKQGILRALSGASIDAKKAPRGELSAVRRRPRQGVVAWRDRDGGYRYVSEKEGLDRVKRIGTTTFEDDPTLVLDADGRACVVGVAGGSLRFSRLGADGRWERFLKIHPEQGEVRGRAAVALGPHGALEIVVKHRNGELVSTRQDPSDGSWGPLTTALKKQSHAMVSDPALVGGDEGTALAIRLTNGRVVVRPRDPDGRYRAAKNKALGEPGGSPTLAWHRTGDGAYLLAVRDDAGTAHLVGFTRTGGFGAPTSFPIEAHGGVALLPHPGGAALWVKVAHDIVVGRVVKA